MGTLSIIHGYCGAGWCAPPNAVALAHTLILCKHRLTICEHRLTSLDFSPVCTSSLRSVIAILPKGSLTGPTRHCCFWARWTVLAAFFADCALLWAKPGNAMGSYVSTYYHLAFRAAAQADLWTPHSISANAMLASAKPAPFTLSPLWPVFQNCFCLSFLLFLHTHTHEHTQHWQFSLSSSIGDKLHVSFWWRCVSWSLSDET